MNNRIKEIAKQAHEAVIKNTPSFLVTKELYEQKFAELIVAECRDMFVVGSASWNLLNEKLEHFGVEE